MEIAFIIVWVAILFEGKIPSFLTFSAIVRVISMPNNRIYANYQWNYINMCN